MKEFTLDELAKYDGKNGHKAYVAVDGIVYDVSDFAGWSGGEHHGNFAGQDQSQNILHSPHGKKKLEEVPKVGKLVK